MIDENKYYVYTLLDSTKPGKYFYEDLDMCFLYEPFYIGKGSGRRYKNHSQKNNLRDNYLKRKVIEKCIKHEIPHFPVKITEGLGENKSFELEHKYVSILGRIDYGGILTNLTDGGGVESSQNMDCLKKPIISTDVKSGEIVKYTSLSEASTKLGILCGNICSCCRGDISYCDGKVFEYENHIDKYKFRSIRNKLINKNRIIQHLTDRCIIFNDMVEASEYNDISTTCVFYSCKGQTGKYSGYDFEYYDSDKREKFSELRKNNRNSIDGGCIGIIQLSMDNTFVRKWDSSSSTTDEKFNASCVTGCCKRRRKSHKGYKWVYESEY